MQLIKTETGQLAFKERSPLLSVRQRSMFILFDGQKSVAQVLLATAGLGVNQTDIDQLLAHGFLESVSGDAVVANGSSTTSTATATTAPMLLVPTPVPLRSDRTDQDRYKDGKVIATQLTASLGLRGFMLNLAVESAAGFDDLLKLFPKIQAAVGEKSARELERLLKG